MELLKECAKEWQDKRKEAMKKVSKLKLKQETKEPQKDNKDWKREIKTKAMNEIINDIHSMPDNEFIEQFCRGREFYKNGPAIYEEIIGGENIKEILTQALKYKNKMDIKEHYLALFSPENFEIALLWTKRVLETAIAHSMKENVITKQFKVINEIIDKYFNTEEKHFYVGNEGFNIYHSMKKVMAEIRGTLFALNVFLIDTDNPVYNIIKEISGSLERWENAFHKLQK